MPENFAKRKRVSIIGMIISSLFLVFYGTIYILLYVNVIFFHPSLERVDCIFMCISGVIFIVFLLLYIIVKSKIRSAKPTSV